MIFPGIVDTKKVMDIIILGGVQMEKKSGGYNFDNQSGEESSKRRKANDGTTLFKCFGQHSLGDHSQHRARCQALDSYDKEEKISRGFGGEHCGP